MKKIRREGKRMRKKVNVKQVFFTSRDGKVLADDRGVCSRWKRYFQGLLFVNVEKITKKKFKTGLGKVFSICLCHMRWIKKASYEG